MFGHEGGDVVLREIGALVRAQIRGSDLACRLGGEELVVILPETELEGAASRAEEIRRGIEALGISFRGQSLGKITASFGVAGYPGNGLDQRDVLRAADLALYRAKSSGRNRVAIASSTDTSSPWASNTARFRALSAPDT
jgi:diguanylate cyclase (GGDEF)-like protein